MSADGRVRTNRAGFCSSSSSGQNGCVWSSAYPSRYAQAFAQRLIVKGNYGRFAWKFPASWEIWWFCVITRFPPNRQRKCGPGRMARMTKSRGPSRAVSKRQLDVCGFWTGRKSGITLVGIPFFHQFSRASTALWNSLYILDSIKQTEMHETERELKVRQFFEAGKTASQRLQCGRCRVARRWSPHRCSWKTRFPSIDSRSKAIGSILLSANAARATCPCSVAKGSRMFSNPSLLPLRGKPASNCFNHPINFGFDRTQRQPNVSDAQLRCPKNTHFHGNNQNRRFFHRQCVGFFSFAKIFPRALMLYRYVPTRRMRYVSGRGIFGSSLAILPPMFIIQPQSALMISVAPVSFSAATLSVTIAPEISACLTEKCAAEAATFAFVVVDDAYDVFHTVNQLPARRWTFISRRAAQEVWTATERFALVFGFETDGKAGNG